MLRITKFMMGFLILPAIAVFVVGVLSIGEKIGVPGIVSFMCILLLVASCLLGVMFMSDV